MSHIKWRTWETAHNTPGKRMMKTCTWEEEDVTHQVEDLGDSSQHTWQEDIEVLHLGGGRHHTSSGGLGRQLTTHLARG